MSKSLEERRVRRLRTCVSATERRRVPLQRLNAGHAFYGPNHPEAQCVLGVSATATYSGRRGQVAKHARHDQRSMTRLLEANGWIETAGGKHVV